MAWKTTEAQRKYQHKKRRIIQAFKKVPCADCGGTFPVVCMDFDHRNPTDKKLNLSETSRHGLQRLLDEVEKCDIVCSNCHRIRTHADVVQ